MKPERTIQTMLDNHPSLFKDRYSAMDHLFFIIGNGYEWYDGELIEDEVLREYDPVSETWVISEIYEAYSDGPDIKKAVQRKRTTEHQENDKLIRKVLNRRLHELGRPTYDEDTRIWSYNEDPISHKYMAFFQIPENITPEWKKLVEELKEVLYQDGIDINTGKISEEGYKHLSKTYRI